MPLCPDSCLNACIHTGASFGYQPGGWGKPPVDETGNPVYGDVFGLHLDNVRAWGAMAGGGEATRLGQQGA